MISRKPVKLSKLHYFHLWTGIKTNYLFPLIKWGTHLSGLLEGIMVRNNLWLENHSIMCNASVSPPCNCLILTHLSQFDLYLETEMKFKTLIVALLLYSHSIQYAYKLNYTNLYMQQKSLKYKQEWVMLLICFSYKKVCLFNGHSGLLAHQKCACWIW